VSGAEIDPSPAAPAPAGNIATVPAPQPILSQPAVVDLPEPPAASVVLPSLPVLETGPPEVAPAKPEKQSRGFVRTLGKIFRKAPKDDAGDAAKTPPKKD